MFSKVSGFIREHLPSGMSKSLVFDEEEVPVDPSRPPRRSPPPVEGNRIELLGNDAPVDEEKDENSQKSNDESAGPLSDEDGNDDDDEKPQYRETSESQPSSPSDSESEFSYDSTEGSNTNEVSTTTNAVAQHPDPLARRSLFQEASSSEGNQVNNAASLSALAPASTAGGVHVSPRKNSVWTQNGENHLHAAMGSPGRTAAFLTSPSRLSLVTSSAHSSPSLLRLSMPLTPRSHARLRQSSLSSSPSPRHRRGVRRSSRESRKPRPLSMEQSFSPTRPRHKKKRKHESQPMVSKVYGEETANDGDEWETYGKVARRDDWKAFLKPTQVNKGDESESIQARKKKARVDGIEEVACPGYSELQPLSVWERDSEQQLLALSAKRQRMNSNIDSLGDWLGSLKSRTRHSSTSRKAKRVSAPADVLMMNLLEDEMHLSIPVHVWSDKEACEQVFAESRPLQDRLQACYDRLGDDWSRNHFGLSNLPGSLLETEVELAWLAEESLYCLECHSWDWTYITIHASPTLKSVLGQDAPVFVRSTVSDEFRNARALIRKALNGGYRRPHMRECIQRHKHLTYLRQKQEEKEEKE